MGKKYGSREFCSLFKMSHRRIPPAPVGKKWGPVENCGTMRARSRSSQNICQMTHPMTPADAYLIKAGDLAALARAESDPFQRAELERLSLAYLRLAEQAERNSLTDLVYETPPTSSDQPQVQQQQQQAQPANKVE